jgi:catalase-peroxidase
MADMIVLGGCAAIEKAAMDGGLKVEVPFTPGRMDATREQTDEFSFAVLEPKYDGFRNYSTEGYHGKEEFHLVDKSQLLKLTVPEMVVLIGGMRLLDANYGHSRNGVFTEKPEVLSNDFFINLLDMGTVWEPDQNNSVYVGRDRKSGKPKWSASRVDLIIGSHSELRAVAEIYASSDGKEKFIKDFISAWVKVMNLDRFDLRKMK